VLPGVQEPVPQRQVRADTAGAAQGGQAPPAQVQAEQVGEAFAGLEPQVEPDAQVAGTVAGQVPGGQKAQVTNAVMISRMARRIAYLMIIAWLRSVRRGRRGEGDRGERPMSFGD
jgi:hypothetical protein